MTDWRAVRRLVPEVLSALVRRHGHLDARVVRSRRHVGSGAAVVATVASSWWAVDEMVRGVNPWRRLLGTFVFAGLVVSLLR